MYNYDPTGSRYNTAEHTLNPRNVGRLGVLWRVPAAGSVFGTPTVSDGVVYAGDESGVVHAIRTDGAPLWSTRVDGPVTDSILLMRDTLVFGDLNGNIYGLNPRNGEIRWRIRPSPHPIAAIYGSATPVGRYFAIGTTIDAEAPGRTVDQAEGGSGSVVLADASDGRVLWQTDMVNPAELSEGATGADVWSTPTFDARTNTLYVTTGNNFNPPVTPTAEAVVALDAMTGAFRWVNQRYPSDVFPSPGTPQQDVDYDFGDSAKIYHLRDSRTVVGAGQKSGIYYVLDAATGALINQLQVEPGGLLGPVRGRRLSRRRRLRQWDQLAGQRIDHRRPTCRGGPDRDRGQWIS
ncbi:MAG: PQQ-binding-like beta-propeller repeat protein [Solirubrobacterales bacterium]|nr:PQQ-binding-like beta-propeller repeat protein [Solirubrobacterales bacterium]